MLEVLHNGMKYKNNFFSGYFFISYRPLFSETNFISIRECIENNVPEVVCFGFNSKLDTKYVDFFKDIGELQLFDGGFNSVLWFNENTDKTKGYVLEWNKKREMNLEIKKLKVEFEEL